jgi:glycosyltransferase involved in cell wall biosynthesis
MKVAVVHSYYATTQPSGENVVVDAQVAALRSSGHEVLLVAARTDDLSSQVGYPARAAWTVATGRGLSPLDEIRAFAPDVVHVHNLFPNFGTRWLQEWPGRVVATMHNFRPLCAAGTFFREGHVCTACLDGDRLAGLRHGCYRGSRVATAPLAWRGRRGPTADAVLQRADALVVLSERSQEVYRHAGVPDDRLHLVPNFVEDAYGALPRTPKSGRWLFAGRLTEEKGIVRLVQRWPGTRSLDVIGDGPARARAQTVAAGDVRFLGPVPHDQLAELMPAYQGLVFPSEWWEGAPLIVAEALAAGLPVVAVDGSSAADLVAETGVGARMPLGYSTYELEEALNIAGDPRLAAVARATFEARLSVRSWLSTMASVYRVEPARAL